MKKLITIILILSILITGVNATYLQTDNINDGYFSVYIQQQNIPKIKIKIAYNNTVKYCVYTPGKTLNYPLEKDGKYTITVYQNVRDNLYKKIETTTFEVALKNKLSPYLISTYEINFSQDDNISNIAKKICAESTSEFNKIANIKKYVKETLIYDYELAKNIKNKKITSYLPDANKVLENKKGICYDYASLFAAMCRSQGIPCKIVTGYTKNNTLHAWNNVYVGNRWHFIDPQK